MVGAALLFGLALAIALTVACDSFIGHEVIRFFGSRKARLKLERQQKETPQGRKRGEMAVCPMWRICAWCRPAATTGARYRRFTRGSHTARRPLFALGQKNEQLAH
jgi:hypothetical protein